MPVVDSIRDFNDAIPFVPYEIYMAGGAKFRVPHPDFVVISAQGSLIVVFDPNGRAHHLNANLIDHAVVVTT